MQEFRIKHEFTFLNSGTFRTARLCLVFNFKHETNVYLPIMSFYIFMGHFRVDCLQSSHKKILKVVIHLIVADLCNQTAP